MKKIFTSFLLGVTCIAATVSFADDYTINIPVWKSNLDPVTYAVNISELRPGEKLEVGYPGIPVWIYRRTAEELEFMSDSYSGAPAVTVDAMIKRIESKVSSTTGFIKAQYQLVDLPELESKSYRSKRKEYLVFEALGRLGCKLQMKLPDSAGMPADAKFHDPCTNATYNLAGRFIGGFADGGTGAIADYESTGESIVPELELYRHTYIPVHQYLSDDTVVIGVSDYDSLPQISLSEESLFSGLTPTETLIKATAFNDLSRAQAALKAGAKVNSTGISPNTTRSLPLLTAVLHSSVEMVELLLSHGAIPGEDEKELAIEKSRYDVSYLLQGVTEQ